MKPFLPLSEAALPQCLASAREQAGCRHLPAACLYFNLFGSGGSKSSTTDSRIAQTDTAQLAQSGSAVARDAATAIVAGEGGVANAAARGLAVSGKNNLVTVESLDPEFAANVLDAARAITLIVTAGAGTATELALNQSAETSQKLTTSLADLKGLGEQKTMLYLGLGALTIAAWLAVRKG
jgi:hypothetical protein